MEALKQLSLSDVVTLLGVLIGTAIGAYIAYFRKAAPAPENDPVLSSIGIELGNRKQVDMLIAAQTRMAVALEALADKRTDEIEAMHRTLLERMDAAEERQRSPPRRRKTTAPR